MNTRNQSISVKQEEGVFRPDPNKPDVVNGAVEVTAYGLGGKEVDVDSSEALAKKSFDPATGVTRYWLKRATAGPDAGRLYNPQSPTFNADAAKRVRNDMGRGQYEFRKATAEAFELYLRFLVTGNPTHIRQAERY